MTKATTKTQPTITKTVEYNACTCGCGEATGATFAPGHDARMVSQLVARWAEASDPTEAEAEAMRQLPTQALQAKFQRTIANARAKVQRAAARDAERQARAAAKQAKTKAA